MQDQLQVETTISCYHCGQPCDEPHLYADKTFCCYGCKTVYEILSANDLCAYYDLEKNPGVSLQQVSGETFSFLDEPSIRKKFLEFDSDSFSRVRFSIPAMHCVSCIWLLENLQKIDKSILRSQVDYPHKTIVIDFNPQKIVLSKLVGLLVSLGYPPKINLDRTEQFVKPISDKTLVLKLAIAGFCFGNVMLFSFPEYLGLDHSDQYLQQIFSWLNIALSIPVLVYSSADYLRSAWQSFRLKSINIDVPIAVGLVVLFGRSVVDIVVGSGPGYLDSFTGLVFFLLIGRWFQSKTYESLAFDRDFKSYFPLAVQRLVKNEWKPVVIYELEKDDIIRVRNMEIVPADSILVDDDAFIDYSFVTGESRPVKAQRNYLVYAGGRLIGKPIMLRVEKKTSQSHLTSLWNHTTFLKPSESGYKSLIDRVAKAFTWAVLGLAILTTAYWYRQDASQMWLIVTAVLMVACPCALALAAPFTYGNMLRVFGRNGLYLKNADIIERMATVNAVVFDKTGTVTHGQQPKIEFSGKLTDQELSCIKLLTGYSTHPLSIFIHRSISVKAALDVTDFKEFPGKGIEGNVESKQIKIGSASFTEISVPVDEDSSTVFVAINGKHRGYFRVQVSIRKNIQDMLRRLGEKCVALLSGDNENDKEKLKNIFHTNAQLLFNQSPHDKLHFIERLQKQNNVIMMVGDGLNDSGALKQSDVGIAVTDDTGIFSPACDGILQGTSITTLDQFLELAKSATTVVKIAFGISFLYNIIALSFAVSGHLTPLVAAILMPLSSISVVVFATVAVKIISKWKLNK